MKLTRQQKITIIDAVISYISRSETLSLCLQLNAEIRIQAGIKLSILEILKEFDLLEFKPNDKKELEVWFPFNKDGQMMRLGILVHIKSKLNTLKN